MRSLLAIALILVLEKFGFSIAETDFEYYCVGNCDGSAPSVPTQPGLVLMGGGADVDSAYKWMIDRAKGGDFVVIRTDNDNLYNQYIYDMGALNSVTTLCLFNRSASFNPFVQKILSKADALWMAGGDQWTYYSFWKDTPIEDFINQMADKIPIGGTSAGMISIGQFVNTAEFSSESELTSKDALNNPYKEQVTIGSDWLDLPLMQNVLTDAHFFQRDRMGRLVTFLARLLEDVYTSVARGIACDEGTALLVDVSENVASITSWWNNGSCYFLQANEFPTTCQPYQPLSISNITVAKLSGNVSNAFDLSSWSLIGGAGESYQLGADDGVLYSSTNSIY